MIGTEVTAALLTGLLKGALISTVSQTVSAAGIFIILGIMLNYVSRMIRTCFSGSGMIKLLIFWTGWLGVPVHEAGHMFFCILFGHRIKKVNLFGPDPKTGGLGYVEHVYSRKNIYSRAGNFFIGAAPLISGAAVLFISSIFLLPNWDSIENIVNVSYKEIHNITTITAYIEYVVNIISNIFNHLFMRENLSDPKFWLFIYISFSIGSHMELSPSDVKSMKEGAVIIILLLFIINVVLQFFGFGAWKLTSPSSAAYIAVLFLWALLMTVINLLLCCGFITIFTLAVRRRLPGFFANNR